MNESSSRRAISIRGARQNNLKNLDLDIATDALTVVTGVSGSGKSSLVFDTLYAEGQRRYVETFSPYARQYLDRMDRPQVERIEGIPPAIAIDQTNPVRTSRSTVGTMTELNDYLKLLFARAATLFCRNCGQPVHRDDATSITRALAQRVPLLGDPRLIIAFSVPVPHNFSEQEVLELLARQGYTRILGRDGTSVEAVQDRFRWSAMEPARLAQALEAALRAGQGRLAVHALAEREGESPTRWRFSTDWHCADCDIHYAEASPAAFSFNSPIGACETCRGFGRVIGVDLALVVPDETKTLRGGAVKPWQTESFKECQSDLETCAKKDGVPLDLPVRDFTPGQRQWLFEGATAWVSWAKSWPGKWYGVRRFFEWLEGKAYKMHIRVLLSRYRSYAVCPACAGARLKPEAQWWRVGSRDNAASARTGGPPWTPQGVSWSEEMLATMPGLTLFELSRLPICRLARFFERLAAELPLRRGARDTALELLLGEIGSRLAYLETVGLGYLTLDRQSRTLSGGEVQRINLTTALGTSLINTLFVLDEPSIGLHPRDVGRIVEVMQRLRDAGNTLVVVEHDPQIMLAADRLIDLGPGPGERGGELVYHGPAAAIVSAATLTAAYLSGAKRVSRARPVRDLAHAPTLRLTRVREHNLKELEVAFPLGGLVCVTGVSGSGKSTLIAEVLFPAVAKALGVAGEAPGRFGALYGAELLGEVVLVDQSPIGKTTRSNPASYVGAFDAIRARFAAQPEAQKRGYTAGTFSFNAGNGRCPACGGNGFEHVEMQFLSDVYLRCPDCNGTRYRSEVGEIKYRGKNIAEVLELTVAETLSFFAEERDLAAKLQPLIDVGLEYLRLGQPVPTLSGGEAQRLKLAGHLAQSAGAKAKPTLFLFDEPTTGLHFEDIAKLLSAFEKLIAAGHSLVVIEHNLDLIAAADWVIDLGPEGGEAGGELVFSGSLAQLLEHRGSFTGAALRDYLGALGVAPGGAAPALHEAPARRYQPVAAAPRPASIVVHHAREHNLKNIDLAIPLDRFTVLTGVSGSGKSTLAFDIIFNEGQRRYLESLNAYARQFVQPAGRPEVDAIHGIPPTVAIEQRTSRGGRKSTVATLTEIYHFLRLWYVKLGTQHCPECQLAIEPQSPEAIAARFLAQWKGHNLQLLAPLVVNRKGLYTDLAKWARNKGFTQLRVDGEMLPTAKWPRLARFSEHNIELPVAKLAVSARNENALREAIAAALEFGKGVLQALPAGATEAVSFSTKRACPGCGKSFAELDPRLLSYNSKHGWCPSCFGTGLAIEGFDAEQSGEEIWWNEWFEGEAAACPGCAGKRLNATALAVRFEGRSIADLAGLPVHDAASFFRGLKLKGRNAAIARDLLTEIEHRLAFLGEVGLGYLSLDRAAPTLSGGEAQRIRLAAQLGSNLQGVCYILDEPTIGLHPRDNRMLLATLAKLAAKGNTLIVVEHDEDTIRFADHVVDLGPGAGVRGGAVVAQGDVKALMANPASITGALLANPLRHPLKPRRNVNRETAALLISGAKLHNLRDLDLRIPLGRLVVITGVSGSGKSTLARDLLHDNLAQRLAADRRGKGGAWLGCREIAGWETLARVLEVDQTPIGKTPRSCPATYVGFFDTIRKLFAETQEARLRGYSASRFSFNVGGKASAKGKKAAAQAPGGGRCAACEGQGVQKIEMSFLPDVKVTCEVCRGQRFDAETLAVRWKGKSVGEVLAMNVDDAVEFFAAHAALCHALKLMQDVGLGYLTLGQASPTLSGGEAQRIKLVTELAKARPLAAEGPGRRGARVNGAQTLYVFDEPTVGLHLADVEKLLLALHRLVEAGNSVVLVEHHLDVMAEADWLIDLGPEGGEGGGRIVAEGTPVAVAKVRGSHTGQALKAFLAERGSGQ